MPRVSANGDAIGDRNKSGNQYGACHAVEYRSPPCRSRRRSLWAVRNNILLTYYKREVTRIGGRRKLTFLSYTF
jgi:hypothetical protein